MRRTLALTLILSLLLTLYNPVFAQESDVEKLLEQGRKAYAEGRFEEAIEKLSLAITLIKNKVQLVDAYLSLALTYFTIGQEEKAGENIRKALSINPKLVVDPEFYPPKFIALVEKIRGEFIVPVTIVLNVPAKIYVDGNFVGQAELITVDLTKNTHKIRAEAAGYRVLEKVVQITRAKQKVELVLEKEKLVKKEKGVIKKKGKKKGIPKALIIAGGVVLLAAGAYLLMGKKEEEEEPSGPRELKLTVVQNGLIKEGEETVFLKKVTTPGTVRNLRYEITIEHPYHKQLTLDIVYQSTKVGLRFTVIRPEGSDKIGKYTYRGSTDAFNGNTLAATWGIMVKDFVSDGRKGRIVSAVFYITYE